ncbi:hypothetical protein OGH69_09160 [Flavobacterium sp. MFBS3-15]|uniref:hypothetical protein n=1 Tax=Flavobacterium sp. MFBS3-15 TaxID=2989816 RepID=UPI00223660BF|nr:hypothetical protein [Flavobacterium sp. MFBS3-15]MCW4469131.1 hypothetical protein [Flavobacterium sp. MFBS3-15]
MNQKILFLMISAIFYITPVYRPASNENYILTSKKGKEIEEDGKKFLAIPVTLTNTSKDTLAYYTMSCSWQDFYVIDNELLKIEQVPCESNIYVPEKVAPGKSTTVILRLEKPVLTGRIKFRTGLNIVPYSAKEKFNREMFRSKKNIIWSNEVTMKVK